MGIIKTFLILFTVSIFSVGCSFFESPRSTQAEENTEISEDFKSEVSLVCLSIEESATQALDTNFSLNDPDFFNETLSSAEEEFDKIIADLTAIDPDAQVTDEWELFVDDFTAIRDSFPELLDVLNQLARLDQQRGELIDPELFEEQQDEIDLLQKEYEMLTRGNSQRLEAIQAFVDEIEISDCNID